MSTPITLIVGAGQAGAECATALRQHGYTGRIILIGDESQLPYRRPPLSKTFLASEVTSDSLQLRPLAAYTRVAVECMIGVNVLGIDRTHSHLELSDGESLAYDTLVLATGGRARRLPSPDIEHSVNVHYIRTIADVERIHRDFQPKARLVIVGGGYIGLETAAVAIKRGLHVTVLESAPRVLVRVTAAEMSAFYESVHREAGVNIKNDAIIEGWQLHGERVAGVRLSNGETIAADLVVVGIGLEPNVEIARAAGLPIDNGIVVDGNARTSDPRIFAIGDCSNQPSELYGRRIRVESVPNAIEQAQFAALTIAGKTRTQASQVPWFWSDQYDLKLQMAGLSQGFDSTVRRESLKPRAFTLFYLKDGLVLAADSVNCPQDFMAAKQLIGRKIKVDAQRLADAAHPVAQFVPKASPAPTKNA